MMCVCGAANVTGTLRDGPWSTTWGTLMYCMSVLGVLHECSWSTTWVFVGYYMSVLRVLHGYPWSTAMVFLKVCNNALEVQHEFPWGTTWVPSRYCMGVLKYCHYVLEDPLHWCLCSIVWSPLKVFLVYYVGVLVVLPGSENVRSLTCSEGITIY